MARLRWLLAMRLDVQLSLLILNAMCVGATAGEVHHRTAETADLVCMPINAMWVLLFGWAIIERAREAA